MNCPPSLIVQETSRVMDITGPENTLILLPTPGDEVRVCGGLIAETCARGRPPFLAILGDGAPDGAARLARERERASRLACRRLGLPEDRLLFVGLRQNDFPAIGTPLASALQTAMAEVSWRRDCNVILAPFASQASQGAADAVMAWQLACALADAIRVPALAGLTSSARPLPRMKHSWRLDARHWDGRKAEAGLAHGDRVQDAGYEVYASLG